MEAIINVRFANGTYIAKASGFKCQASCTGEPPERFAVVRCAENLAKGRDYSLQRVTDQTFICTIKE